MFYCLDSLLPSVRLSELARGLKKNFIKYAVKLGEIGAIGEKLSLIEQILTFCKLFTVIIVCVTEEAVGGMHQFGLMFDFAIWILHNSATYCYTESATIPLVLMFKLRGVR